MADQTVKLNEGQNRYEIFVDDKVAGYAAFRETGEGLRDFNHTVIQPEFRGQGLSTPLIQHALDDTRTAGKKIIPTCSAVAHFLSKNEGYRDLVAS
ncbi:GNAT family N-acetyltransferase [Corynebacterium sanguinis]|uniref:N-acetyltransferase n=1 Tax=Corynebacterium sanguinis TaxID=2594913 RepID=A0A6C1TYY8_9CORY|nr:GNAT family N-acetyltransferase [Corynebacterium sanguinis]MCT1614025.1 N-acetyltransferase [Corynebacterium sanguinis]TVS22882.1 N-acetyltransferase [Corynebacterium sanguinis]TVS28568.1 N-acetyltransferase [Corynebacterium sanguinis]